MDYQKLFKSKLDRRRLLGNLGLMGAGAVMTACGGAIGQPTTPPDNGGNGGGNTTNLDPAILNFALNLEYLEAAFYLAAVGRINEINTVGGDADIILPGDFDGTTSIEFDDDDVAAYADEIATDELNHVNFLRGALSDAAADRPVLDFGTAFPAAAAAAFPDVDPSLTAQFNPFANQLFFLHGAFIFEDVGVTAYSGAAPAITDKTGVLAPAAGILAVESYHAGEIRTLLYQQRDTPTPFGAPVSAVVQGISDLRGSLGGGKDEGIVNDDGSANIIPTDENSVAFARTPRQVANIVYFAEGATSGGFFPNGITVPTGQEAAFAALLAL